MVIFSCGINTVNDADGNTYNTVLIGSQCWMGENMRTKKYPDGAPITKGPSRYGDWHTDQSYYSCPPNTGNIGEDCAAAGGAEKLGMLYQWSAAMNGSTSEGAQGICPSGWHIPTDAQYKTLEMALGMSQAQADAEGWRGTIEGDKLKESELYGTSGFNGLLTGYRYTSGSYDERGSIANFWSSTPSGDNAWRRFLVVAIWKVGRSAYSKTYGFSVRCIKD